MNEPSSTPARSGLRLSTVVFALAMVLLGLLTGVAPLLGPVAAVAGVAASAYLRPRLPKDRTVLALAPALFALGLLVLIAPVAPSSELFGGLAALTFLLWLADDPSQAPGGGRRALPLLAVGGLSFALAWSLTLSVTVTAENLEVAAALAAAALVLVGVVLYQLVGPGTTETA